MWHDMLPSYKTLIDMAGCHCWVICMIKLAWFLSRKQKKAAVLHCINFRFLSLFLASFSCVLVIHVWGGWRKSYRILCLKHFLPGFFHSDMCNLSNMNLYLSLVFTYAVQGWAADLLLEYISVDTNFLILWYTVWCHLVTLIYVFYKFWFLMYCRFKITFTCNML